MEDKVIYALIKQAKEKRASKATFIKPLLVATGLIGGGVGASALARHLWYRWPTYAKKVAPEITKGSLQGAGSAAVGLVGGSGVGPEPVEKVNEAVKDVTDKTKENRQMYESTLSLLRKKFPGYITPTAIGMLLGAVPGIVSGFNRKPYEERSWAERNPGLATLTGMSIGALGGMGSRFLFDKFMGNTK